MMNMRATRGKTKSWVGLLGVLALAVSQAAPAHAIDYTPDELLGGIDSANSGQAYEEAQLEALCGCNVTLLSNVNIDNDHLLTDDSGDNVIDVAPGQPGYFLLKFGTGNSGNDMFFFRNNPDSTKLVWNDSQLTGADLPPTHVDSISHYAITSDPPTTVPEPAS